MLEHKIGNLLKAPVDTIIHGVNCQGVMNSGIARQIREMYPEVYDKYKEFCDKGDRRSLLGRYQGVVTNDGTKVIFNAFTQLNYGQGVRQVSYDAIDDSLRGIEKLITTTSPGYVSTVGIPKIGAGLGGGEWSIIEEIVKHAFQKTNVEVYSLEGN